MADRFRERKYRNRYRNGNSRHNELGDRSGAFQSGGYSDGQNYNQKVSFKANNRGNQRFWKSWNTKSDLVCDQLDNELFNRNSGASRNGGSRRLLSGRRNVCSRGGGYNNFRSSWTLKMSVTGWYSIFVPNVYDGDEVLKIIQTYIAPITFFPYNKSFVDNGLRFLVDDYKVAETLLNTSYKLSLSDGRKLIIKTTVYVPSHYSVITVPVPEEIKAKMIEVISTRYKPDTKSLDLSHFHSSQIFIDNQMYAPLNQPTFLLAALNLVAQQEKYDLYGLSLENNLIYLGKGLAWIRRLFPDLKVLNLAGNKLKDINELQELSGFTIEELNLSRNPLSDMVDAERYRRDVQDLFPLLNKLDDYELPSRYSAAIVGIKLKMPFIKGNSYAVLVDQNPEQPNSIAVLVDSFLAQYYERYDNPISKQLVAEAYHHNATFSMSSCIILDRHKGNLTQYLQRSRNLLAFPKINLNKKSYRGRENIFNFLEKLPKSKHDLGSFTVDVPLANTTMVQIVVNGVFAEGYVNNDKLLLRSFSRIFAITPVGNGWSILSDMLFITGTDFEMVAETAKRFYVPQPRETTSKKRPHMDYNGNNNNCSESMFMDDGNDMGCMGSVRPNYSPPSYQQTKCYSNQLHYQMPLTFQSGHQTTTNTSEQNCAAQGPFDSKVLETVTRSTQLFNNNVMPPVDNRATRLTIVKLFSNESGMNVTWAEKCLAENNWNYTNAALNFSKLKANIPKEAFQH
ncbi:nuclear RNA export factor 1-like [Adelges cooleyi]|uniref:nuclear RNA export factor 1-like n=1 Tax=Adelges cooleyi TaxID=133065 RepID=UPI00217F2F4B|nr:nuclear RNA export factor 1-like [Adelges cooleyi]